MEIIVIFRKNKSTVTCETNEKIFNKVKLVDTMIVKNKVEILNLALRYLPYILCNLTVVIPNANRFKTAP